MTPTGCTILIVDDDATDVLFTEHAISKLGLPLTVEVSLGGENALAFLRDRIARKQQLPALMLLDVKMPGMDGFDVLTALRADPAFAKVRTVMHSSSDDPGDIRRARDLGAIDYVRKYPTPDQLKSLIAAAATP